MAKKTTTRTPTAVAAPERNEDLSFVQEAGAAVVAFLKKAAEFLSRANDLEKRANEVLTFAKTIKPPTSGAEDVELQKFIQRCNVGTKTVGAHWDGTDVEPGITKILHRLHRRTTQKRDVALGYLKEAADIGNRLHNGWTRAENERAENERRRLQAIEDQKAAAARQKELDDLEAAAVKAEEASPDLSEREEKFVIAIAVNYDPTVAAREAGYADPSKRASILLQSKKIQKAIEARRKANAAREQAEALKTAPVEAAQVEVEADVQQAPGAHDRTQWKLESYDVEVLVAAAIKGDVPRDLLTIDETRLKQYVRNLKQHANRWPGVKAVPDTKVV